MLCGRSWSRNFVAAAWAWKCMQIKLIPVLLDPEPILSTGIEESWRLKKPKIDSETLTSHHDNKMYVHFRSTYDSESGRFAKLLLRLPGKIKIHPSSKAAFQDGSGLGWIWFFSPIRIRTLNPDHPFFSVSDSGPDQTYFPVSGSGTAKKSGSDPENPDLDPWKKRPKTLKYKKKKNVFIIFSTLNPILFVRFLQNLINEHHLDPFSSLKNLKCKKNGRIRLDPVPDPKHWIFCFILRNKNTGTKYQCCFAGIGARGAEIIWDPEPKLSF